MISILFHHYKELLECIREVEELEAKVNGEDNKCSTIKEEETEEMEEIILTATTLDGFFFFIVFWLLGPTQIKSPLKQELIIIKVRGTKVLSINKQPTLLLLFFFHYSPYPSPLMRITFKAEWNNVSRALNRTFSYVKLRFDIFTVGTFEA